MSILTWEEFNEGKKDGLTAGQKKLPQALQDAILKKKGQKPEKDDDDDDKDDKEKKGKKEDKDDDKDDKKDGLTAGQKKLPQALQDAILKKQKKRS
jgi:phosphopantothenoylcysteine synthetase/decarboxylase